MVEGFAATLLALGLAIGPNGYVLEPALEPAPVRRHLPGEALLSLVPHVWVVFHRSSEWAMASYEPARGRASGSLEATVTALLLGAEARPERQLPGLDVPRIYLYAPYYRHDGRLVPATDMTIDVAQYFAQTLLEALLDLVPPRGFEPRAAAYGRLAASSGEREIPPGERRGAYISALAQFGSEAFSVAVELRRSLARQRAAGKDPCRAVDLPGTLFGQWGRIFDSIEYRGLYTSPGAAPGGWALGPAISASDKRFLIREVFDDFWTGDVRRDFALRCP